MSDYAIKVDQVSKIYKLYNKPSDRLRESLKLTRKKLSSDHVALNEVSFQVNKGETVGIIGTNGSGKSTILKIITGVLNPTSGEVDIKGRISALLELGAGFNMEYTGIENVYLNGTMMGFSREEIDAKLQDILDFADIGDFVYQPVKTYSSGMFVRLAFAVAINIDPEILIVDEALSVGDVFFQAKCFHKFEEFKELGKTILFVSHDLSSIQKYCDRVILLNNGDIIAEGDSKEIVNIFKKLLVNQLEVDDEGDIVDNKGYKNTAYMYKETCWKDSMTINSETLDYGGGEATVYDFGIFDMDNNLTGTIEKGSEFVFRVKVRFNAEVENPIFTYTIRDKKGTDITGTNTMFEKVHFPKQKAGDEQIIAYKQRMNLQGGEYLVSFSCTGFRNGEFVVYHRLYDVCVLTVIDTRRTVGFFDMFTEVTVETNKSTEE